MSKLPCQAAIPGCAVCNLGPFYLQCLIRLRYGVTGNIVVLKKTPPHISEIWKNIFAAALLLTLCV